jgi:hypothetical protein
VASVGLVATMQVFPGGMVMELSARSAIRWSLSAVHDFRALTHMVTPRSKALSCIGGPREHPARVCRDNLATDLRLCCARSKGFEPPSFCSVVRLRVSIDVAGGR